MRILLAEDDQNLNDSLKYQLEQEGFLRRPGMGNGV